MKTKLLIIGVAFSQVCFWAGYWNGYREGKKGAESTPVVIQFVLTNSPSTAPISYATNIPIEKLIKFVRVQVITNK
jgi:hypothetical protein